MPQPDRHTAACRAGCSAGANAQAHLLHELLERADRLTVAAEALVAVGVPLLRSKLGKFGASRVVAKAHAEWKSGTEG